MKVDAILAENLQAALAAAKYVSYIDLKKLNGVARKDDLDNPDGTRFLKENNWRLQDAREILKLLDLSKNGLMILKLLHRRDWLRIMSQMPKETLLRGLRFFSRDKLLRMVWFLPMEIHVKLLLKMFGLKRLVEKMRMPEMIHMLKSQKLPMRILANRLMTLDRKFLLMLMGKITGQNMDNLTKREMLPMLQRMKKGQVLEGLKFLPYKAMHPLMMHVFKKQPELLMRMSDAFLANVYQRVTMPQLLRASVVFPKGTLLKLLEQLSDDFLVMVPAMADEGMLAGMLLSEHSDVLLSLGASLLAA